MPAFEPLDPDFARRVRESFSRQTAMATMGVTIQRLEPGELDLVFDYRSDLTQQHGFIHGGVVTAVVDSACGYAALSLMPPGAAVLSVEFKVNLLAPAEGERFLARGRVVKPGRNLMVCSGEVVAQRGGVERAVALMQATMMVLRDRPGLTD